MCYSQEWQLTFGDIDLNIVTLYDNTEVSLPFRFYEGSTTITGTVGGIPVTGIGFAELLHSYENPQLQINYPIGGNDWNINLPVSWELLNPDDGRNIYYDVELSTDNKATFTPIVQGLVNTSYLFDTTQVPLSADCWLRIKGYSNDTTLFGIAEMVASSFSVDAAITGMQANISSQIKIFPNPFTDQVQIKFHLLKQSLVKVEIVNLSGKVVQTLVNNYRPIGKNSINWDGLNENGQKVNSGIYCLRINTNGQFINKNIIVLK